MLSRNDAQLIKVRNPWVISSSEKYTGHYSDNPAIGKEVLTSADRLELDHPDENDRVFYMSVEDFKNEFEFTSMNFDNSDWHHAWHLTIDDDYVGSRPGIESWCGSSCYRYRATITNLHNSANTIHPGIHIWRWRTYAQTSKCMQRVAGTIHSIERDGYGPKGLYEGNKWLDTISLAPAG
jgi:hypothetical protein